MALLVAAELIARGKKCEGQEQGGWIFISPSVVTFGAPMVIVPDTANDVWRRLNTSASLFINTWDAVPRLPSSEAWLFRVLPSREVAGIAPVGNRMMVERHLRPAFWLLSLYDTCGTLVCFGCD